MQTTDDTFISKIVQSPADDSQRLAYAQWLESRGDPRGEFIKVQCEIARREARNPLDPFPIGPELYIREAQLLGQHADEWLSGVEALSLDKGAFSFHRGMIEEVECDIGYFVDSGHELLTPVLPHLTRLKLVRNDETIPPGLGESQHLKQFRWLSLEKCPLGEVGVVDLLSSSVVCNLCSLRLGFEGAQDKQWLRDEGWLLGNATIQAICSSPHLLNLIELRSPSMDIDSQGLAAISQGGRLANLEMLDVSDCEIDQSGLRHLLSSLGPSRLRYLDVEANSSIGNAGAAILATSPPLSSLRVLNVASTNLGVEGLRQLCLSPPLRGVEFLYLGNNAVEDDGVGNLATTGVCPDLKILHLNQNRLSAVGLTLLFSSPAFEHLEKLVLDECEISDAEISAMLTSFHLPRLRHLSLRKNNISGAAAMALAASPAVFDLATLDLRLNPIPVEGIESLLASAFLRKVSWLGLPCVTLPEKLRGAIRDRFGY